MANIQAAETEQGHVMADPLAASKSAAKNAPPRGYFVPNFGVDQDMKDTQSNIAH